MSELIFQYAEANPGHALIAFIVACVTLIVITVVGFMFLTDWLGGEK